MFLKKLATLNVMKGKLVGKRLCKEVSYCGTLHGHPLHASSDSSSVLFKLVSYPVVCIESCHIMFCCEREPFNCMVYCAISMGNITAG